MSHGDDFSAFAGSEHMFCGLSDPYRCIRDEVERGLRQQVPGTVVDAIRTFGTPKFLTLGVKSDDGRTMLVTYFGFCVLAELDVSYEGERERLPAALTFLFGRINEPGQALSRTHIDLHADAERGFDDKAFQKRFLAFRHEG